MARAVGIGHQDFGDLRKNGWFSGRDGNYNDFVKAMLLGDLDAMNEYMNRVTLNIFSYFDTGKSAYGAESGRYVRNRSETDRGEGLRRCAAGERNFA